MDVSVSQEVDCLQVVKHGGGKGWGWIWTRRVGLLLGNGYHGRGLRYFCDHWKR